MFIKKASSKSRIVKNIFGINFNGNQNKRTFSENVLKCPSADVCIPNISVTEWLYSKMEPFHKYTAIECAESGKKYTFEQIKTKANNLSRSLRKNWNLQPGDVVAIYSSNSADFPIACMGSLEAGLVITTMNPLYRSEEVSKQLTDSSAKIIITEPHNFNEAKMACKKIGKYIPIICTKSKESESLPESAINFEELINAKIDFPDSKPRKPDDVAFLPYSSGTTGVPKGVELTHHNIVSMGCETLHPDYQFFPPPTDNHQEVMVGLIPMYHIYGFILVQQQYLSTGMRIISLPKFSPDLFISVIKRFKVKFLYGVPPVVLFLTNHPGVKPEYLDSLQYFSSAAAPLGPLDEKKFKQKFGSDKKFFQGYGLTEAAGMVATSAGKKFLYKPEDFKGSSGAPTPNTLIKIIKVNDPAGTPLGPNERGEILIKGPHIMKGYLNNPTETQKTFLDGWFKSGDIGHYDTNNVIYVTERLKELIKVKGFQVAPAELEEIIRDFPSVQEAAVIGISHPQLGEVPRAYVVKKIDSKLTGEEVEKFVAGKVAKYKHLLGGVEIVDSIPKNPSGKILRKLLKQEYEGRVNK